MKYYIHTIIHFSLLFFYIIFTMRNLDSLAWFLMNISILIGVIGPLLLWIKTNFKTIGFGITYLKLTLILFFMWDWWEFTYSKNLTHESDLFFWTMSPFLLILGIFETQIICKHALKKP
jgi:hypothetical protein